jgi:hypothetical protein
MMRFGMGLAKNEHGVFHVRRKVPKALEVLTARVLGASKERVSWLKRTLGTKDQKRAKVLAKPIMMEFDRILAQAEALLVEHPVRTELTEAEIKQIADYVYAHHLGADQELREEGIGSDPVFASVHRQLVEAGIEFETQFEVAEETGSGLSARMMHKIEEDASGVLSAAKEALARGNVSFIRYELGWDKIETRKKSTRMEFSRGIERFIELHGALILHGQDRSTPVTSSAVSRDEELPKRSNHILTGCLTC